MKQNNKQAERLNPLNSIVFATIFESEKKSGKAMLELINSILIRQGEEPVKEILSMTSEHSIMGENKGQKYGRLDVRVVSESNRIFNVEVQLAEDYMVDRGYFYGSRVGAKAFEEGMPYNDMPQVRVICIENFYIRNCGHDIVEPVILAYENKPVEKATDVFAMYHIQMPEFRKRYKTLESVKDDPFLTWLYLLDYGYKNADEMEELSKMTEGMRNFAEQYGIAINDPELVEKYERYSDALHEEASRLAFATNKGIEQGIKQGIEQGIKQGTKSKGFDAVDRLVASGLADVERACEILAVDLSEYRKYVAAKNNSNL